MLGARVVHGPPWIAAVHPSLHLMSRAHGLAHSEVENWQIKSVVAVSPMNHDESALLTC
jgi:hypothetical protein